MVAFSFLPPVGEPDYLAVEICDWSTSSMGNPIARHYVYTSTPEGCMVRLLTSRKTRAVDVGYGDRLDSCPAAIKRAGFKFSDYALVKVGGDRYAGMVALYKRVE